MTINLYRVVTTFEAVELFGISEKSLRWTRQLGKIECRKSKGAWLYDLDSLESVYGKIGNPKFGA